MSKRSRGDVIQDDEDITHVKTSSRNKYQSENTTDFFNTYVSEYAGETNSYSILVGIEAIRATKNMKILLRNMSTLFLENPNIVPSAIKYLHTLYAINNDKKMLGFMESVSQLFTCARDNMLFEFVQHHKLSKEMVYRLGEVYEFVKAGRKVQKGSTTYRKTLEEIIFSVTDGFRESKLFELKSLIYMNIMQEKTSTLERIHNHVSYLVDSINQFFEKTKDSEYELIIPGANVAMIQVLGNLLRIDTYAIIFKANETIERESMSVDDNSDDESMNEPNPMVRVIRTSVNPTTDFDELLKKQLDQMQDEEDY